MKNLTDTLKQLERQLLAAKASHKLLDFIQYTKPEYQVNWHHRYICEQLDKWVNGDINRLMLFIPPQEGKSEIVSRRLPAYILGKNPDASVIGASYSADLASSFNRDIQRVIDSDLYRDVFDTRLATGKDNYIRTTDAFEIVDHNGFYKSTGVGGALTGQPAKYAIIDDPIKDAMEAFSPTYRDRVWDWYINVLQTSLHNDSKVLLTMTRWHEDDLAGRILANEPDKWMVIKFPAIKEREDLSDPRQIGEPLWADRHNLQFLMDVKNRSHRTWISLYQQEPAPMEGNMINRYWFKSFNASDLPNGVVRNFRTDTAYGKEGSDNSATICYSYHNNNLYIWNIWKANLGLPDFIRSYKDFLIMNGYTPQSRAYFEPKATGISAVQTLRLERIELNGQFLGINVIEGNAPTDSKLARVAACSPTIEAGRVLLLANQGWASEFLDECTIFPNGIHDDQVDVLSAIINEEMNSNNFAFAM